jgi:hypothetical protein
MCLACETNPFIRIIHDENGEPVRPQPEEAKAAEMSSRPRFVATDPTDSGDR